MFSSKFGQVLTFFIKTSDRINNLEGSEIEITEALQLIVLIEGTREVERFNTVRSIIEQEDNVTFGSVARKS